MGSLGATMRGAFRCLVIALVVSAPASALGLSVIDLPLLPLLGDDGGETTTTTTSTTTTTTLLPLTLPTLLTTTTTEPGSCEDGDECTSTTSTSTTSTSTTSTTVAATTTTTSTLATTSTTVAGGDDGALPPGTSGSAPGPAPPGSQGLEALDLDLLSPSMAGVVALLEGEPYVDESDDAAHRDGAGTVSIGMHHLLSPVLPPAVVDAVLSPFVIFEALLEALVSSGQALIVPGVAFFLGFGVPGIRRRITFGAAVAE